MSIPRQIQFVRGNTQCINQYTGPIGSLAINTDNYNIHVQDGVTPGGYVVSGGGTSYGNANVAAYLIANGYLTSSTANLNIYAWNANLATYAWNSNVNAVISSLSNYALNANVPSPYGNTNVAAYLSTNNYLTITSANLSLYAWNANVSNYGNANVASYLSTNGYNPYSNVNVEAFANISNYAYNANVTAANVGMKGYVDNAITTITGGAPAILDTLGELANALGGDANLSVTITSLISNVQANVNAINANLSTYAWNANVTAANVGIIGYIDQANTIQSNQISAANVGMQGYVNLANSIQSAQITNLANNMYTNANVQAYSVVWTSDFRPSANATYNIGNTTNQWNSITANALAINSGTISGLSIGYRDIPQVTLSSNVSITTSDAGKHYYSTVSANPQTLTIANNASQAFSIGATINVVNGGTANIILTQGSGVTLYLAGNSTASNRTLTSYGMATITKVATNTWYCVGVGLA